MKKIFQFLFDNILFLATIFLLAFIPLYPKLPLLDIKNTWVYVRVEDFLVLFVLFIWLVSFFRNKIKLNTPLTIPILLFWVIGAVATIHGVLIIFPSTANIFPNVALLSYIRHIEYMGLFFVAYSGVKDRKFLPYVLYVVTGTFLGVVLYGFGQKYLSFPAFLTMNEEFAKGVPIHLSQLSRLPSTFAGHYDLAAYLVLVIPILVSLFFGVKNLLLKVGLVLLTLSGFYLMFMTVSRVSFFVLIVSLFTVLFFQKRKIVLLSIPLIVFGVGVVFLLGLQTTLSQRFSNTVKEVDVMVNGKTGAAVGNVTYVPAKYIQEKIVKIQRIDNEDQLSSAIGGKILEQPAATSSALLPAYMLLEANTLVPMVVASNISTGENLPQGTGYINLSLSPVKNRVGDFFYELSPNIASTTSAQILNIHGDFIIKKASAYDLSFTTRFQGEWPNAIIAFQRNILMGSGYGSVSLAVDNNYLRMLGEIGLLGIASFLSIFIVIGIYIKKTYSSLESKLAKSFIVGYVAGVFGLLLNAILIDVFEASKIAFLLWLLTGVALATTHLYSSKRIDALRELRRAATSSLAIIVYLLIAYVGLSSRFLSNLFVASDYSWFRAAASTPIHSATGYFIDMNAATYGPLTKLYFLLMYKIFWLNQNMYHLVSLSLHFAIAVLFYFIANKILRSKLLASAATFLFLVLSGYSEAMFWISSTGYLFAALFSMLSLMFFIQWEQSKLRGYYVLAFICLTLGMLWNEVGIVTPFILFAYRSVIQEEKFKKVLLDFKQIILFLPLLIIVLLRGKYVIDVSLNTSIYSYIVHFGSNIISKLFQIVVGSIGSSLSTFLETHVVVLSVLTVSVVAIFFLAYKKILPLLQKRDKKIVIFGLLFFAISIIPFIWGEKTYATTNYLPSLGILLVSSILIKKLYESLIQQGKEIAVLSMALVLFVFSLFHIIQLQQQQGDWRTAGEKVRNFFISIDDLYTNNWSQDKLTLNFVNVPISHGDAWVFPTGLEDALWFAFQNKNLTISTYQTREQALKEITISPLNKVFEFDDNGNLTQISKAQATRQ